MTKLDESVVLWRDAIGGREGSHLLIVMHGYGSNEADLFQLAPLIPDHITVAALRAPITLNPGNQFMAGQYSWFPLMQEDPDPTLIDVPVAAVIGWLNGLPEAFASVGLLGFSQGGAMSLQLARTEPERFDYVVQLSGFVNPQPQPGDAVLKLREPRMPAFQAWGTFDDVIGQERTDAAAEWMADHLDVEEHSYPMPHSIVQEEMADIASFLTRVTG